MEFPRPEISPYKIWPPLQPGGLGITEIVIPPKLKDLHSGDSCANVLSIDPSNSKALETEQIYHSVSLTGKGHVSGIQGHLVLCRVARERMYLDLQRRPVDFCHHTPAPLAYPTTDSNPNQILFPQAKPRQMPLSSGNIYLHNAFLQHRKA